MFYIDNVCDIAKEAGNSSVDLRLRGLDIWRKSDGSILTNADKVANKIVIDGLKELTGDRVPIISKENGYKKNLEELRRAYSDTGCYWIIDSLNGGEYYRNNEDYFAVNIAFVKQNEFGLFIPEKGVVYFPEYNGGSLYLTDDDGRAFRQVSNAIAQEIRVNDKVGGELKASVPFNIEARPDDIFGVDYSAVPFAGGGRILMVADGEADIAILENDFSYWDVAAGVAILKAAGGVSYDLVDNSFLSLNGSGVCDSSGSINNFALNRCCFSTQTVLSKLGIVKENIYNRELGFNL